MTPDVVVDVGNSRIKWGRVADGRIIEAAAFGHDDAVGWKRTAELWGLTEFTRWALAGVVPQVMVRFTDWLDARGWSATFITAAELDIGHHEFHTAVAEPDRIGIDRLLTALAAWRRPTNGKSSVVVLNVGTAMTIDFVECRGRHCGGVILPGPRLMARSLHEYTAKLPLVDVRPVPPSAVWGENTEQAITLGIASAVIGAADQMVWDWAAANAWPPVVFITGGDAGYFGQYQFTADVAEVVRDPHLTLCGIRIAAEALP